MQSLTRSIAAAIPLYLGFAATGVGVALPGALLPALIARWRLGDEQGGRLFLMAWAGSSLGALLVRGSLPRVLACGSLAVAVAAAALARSGGSGVHAWMALYGLGLGMSMTSISLIRQQQASAEPDVQSGFQTRIRPGPASGTQTGAEMVRLNLLWAIGACAAPSLTVGALTAGAIQPLLLALAALFCLLAAWAAAQPRLRLRAARPDHTAKTEQQTHHLAQPQHHARTSVFQAVPPGLILMIFLITGIEASAGGWLATYARRGGHGVAETIAAPTCLWAGLLLSRLFWSLNPRLLASATVVRASLSLMGVASALLLTSAPAAVMLAAAFALGFGIGPTYPLLLAWALDLHRGGTIFFLAGVGSACLPWLTGLVSAERASLRTGLAVPLLGTLVMLGVAVSRPLKRWSGEPGWRISGE